MNEAVMKLSKLISFKRDRKMHWDRVYKESPPTELGWYQAHPEMSLKLISETGIGLEGGIIDVGGGTSKLIRLLLDKGYRRLTVLDISSNSIERAKIQFGQKANLITWIEADITDFKFTEQYDLWHDRAVFHFLTDSQDRKGYIDSLNQALNLDGHLIISTFGLDAPPRCSGLKVARYSPETLHKELGDNFDLIDSSDEVHTTPSGVKQSFTFCRFIKRTSAVNSAVLRT
jgi:SAM-dependent methyltransferase